MIHLNKFTNYSELLSHPWISKIPICSPVSYNDISVGDAVIIRGGYRPFTVLRVDRDSSGNGNKKISVECSVDTEATHSVVYSDAVTWSTGTLEYSSNEPMPSPEYEGVFDIVGVIKGFPVDSSDSRLVRGTPLHFIVSGLIGNPPYLTPQMEEWLLSGEELLLDGIATNEYGKIRIRSKSYVWSPQWIYRPGLELHPVIGGFNRNNVLYFLG